MPDFETEYVGPIREFYEILDTINEHLQNKCQDGDVMVGLRKRLVGIMKSSPEIRKHCRDKVLDSQSYAIDGNVGAGKSYFTERLIEDMLEHGDPAIERVKILEKGFEEFLELVRDSPERWAPNMQTTMLHECYDNMKDGMIASKDNKIFVQDRAMPGNACFTFHQWIRGILPEKYYEKYQMIYQRKINSIDKDHYHPCFIFLDVSPERCHKSVHGARRRPGEEGYTLEYLRELGRIFTASHVNMYVSGEFPITFIPYDNRHNSEGLSTNLTAPDDAPLVVNDGIYFQIFLYMYFRSNIVVKPDSITRGTDMRSFYDAFDRIDPKDVSRRFTIFNIIDNGGVINLQDLDNIIHTTVRTSTPFSPLSTKALGSPSFVSVHQPDSDDGKSDE